MQIHTLRNANGLKIGEIETLSNGIQVLRGANGLKLGEYDPKQNVTRGANNLRVGDGNLLTMLLK